METRRSAVITGSTKGWGFAVAQGLAAQGIGVVVNGRGDAVETVVQSFFDARGVAVGAGIRPTVLRGLTGSYDRRSIHMEKSTSG